MKRKPIVAIVGRPNVGKSTFVNRLIGSRESIVDDMPGVTRDRIYFDVEWLNKQFTVIDTGGIVPGDDDEIMMSIFDQVNLATDEADKIIFIVDAKDGVTPVDEDIANLLRRSKKQVFLAVNKIDDPSKEALASDFYSLSLGETFSISAMHGSGGVGDLLDEITKDFEVLEENQDDETIRLAIIGKPNAGKSSLINKVLGKERLIVSEVSGTTRDAIDSEVTINKQKFILVDTAGIRKKSKVDFGVEKFAVARAIKTIREAHIAILMIDANEGLTDQDKKIANMTMEAGKGLIIAVNKWDLIEDKEKNSPKKYTDAIYAESPFLSFAPILFISAKTGQRINKIFETALEVYENCTKEVSTSILNRIMLEAFALNPPTSKRGKRVKAYYTTQIKASPPTFVTFINDIKLLQDSYKRYLEKKLREAFGFFGTPIIIMAREKKEKALKRKKR